MKRKKEAYSKLLSFFNSYDTTNDPLYKQGLLGIDWFSAYMAANDPIAQIQKNLSHVFPPLSEHEYSDNLNKSEPDYRKPAGYDSPIADILKLYDMILNLYDMTYRMREYQSGVNGGLEGKVDG